jgi:integrase
MSRDFYLHKRKNGFYYVEFIDKVTGSKLSARSTGETEKIKAQVMAETWLLNGIPTGRMKKPRPIEQAAGIESVVKLIRKSELDSDDALRIVETLKNMGLIDIAAVKNTGAGAVKFIDYLKVFWDYEKSEYIKNRLGHGKRIGRNHAHQCMLKVNSVLTDFFRDKKLNCITTDDLRKLTTSLYERGLSTSTTNQIMLCAETPIKWAYKRGIIPSDPCIGLDKFSIVNKERGILTEAEAAEVLRPEHWKDDRAFIASLLSFTTGARQGEILALRPSSINNDLLSITNSYSRIDGLKCPKNTKKRPVPLYPYAKQYLLDLLKKNPHNCIDDPFFFYSLQPDKPCDCKVLLDGLREVLEKVGIDWKARDITFHSWRHWYITHANMESDAKKVMKASGHLTESTFQRYAAHVDENNIREVGQAMGKVFDNILLFRKAV